MIFCNPWISTWNHHHALSQMYVILAGITDDTFRSIHNYVLICKLRYTYMYVHCTYIRVYTASGSDNS